MDSVTTGTFVGAGSSAVRTADTPLCSSHLERSPTVRRADRTSSCGRPCSTSGAAPRRPLRTPAATRPTPGGPRWSRPRRRSMEPADRAREQLKTPGEYLCYEEAGELRTVALTSEWTRIGRSLAADVRFDDPTVSRRHALIVRHADGVRLLDDRSLNGVFVNGSRVDGRTLQDGDEIIVGRYRLSFISVPGVAGGEAEPAPGRPRRTAWAEAPPPAVPRRAMRVVSRHDRDDRGALPEGRHRKDHCRPYPHRRPAPVRAACARRRPRPPGQPF